MRKQPTVTHRNKALNEICKVCKDECAYHLSLLLSENRFQSKSQPCLSKKLKHLCSSSKILHKGIKDKFEETKSNLKNVIELPKLKECSIILGVEK